MISIVACCHDAKLCAHAVRVSDRNKMVLWPGCEGRAELSLYAKNVLSVWFVAKRRRCCCNLPGGVALIVWFTTNGMCVKNNTIMYVARTSNNRVIPMEWSYWVTSNNACEPGEQLIVLANGDDESDLYCCLLPQCKLCAYAARDFRLQQNQYVTQ